MDAETPARLVMDDSNYGRVIDMCGLPVMYCDSITATVTVHRLVSGEIEVDAPPDETAEFAIDMLERAIVELRKRQIPPHTEAAEGEKKAP